MKPAVAIRVDASPLVGTGHVMRCLTLAQALRRRGIESTFITRAFDRGGAALIRAAEFPCRTLDVDPSYAATWLGASHDQEREASDNALAGSRWSHVIVDHYELDAQWERACRAHAEKVIVIDDSPTRDHDCDVLLDQNWIDDPKPYRCRVPAAALLLLGPRYTVLRDEFLQAKRHVRAGAVSRVFVCFGGADAGGLTARALEALGRVGWHDVAVDVVAGPANIHAENIHGHADERISVHVATGSTAALMERADLAIGAGGTTTWERAMLGVPSLVVAVADNQRPIVARLDELGVVWEIKGNGERGVDAADLERALRAARREPQRLAQMSRRCLELTAGAGQGANAVADIVLDRCAA